MSGYDSWLEAPYARRANQELMWERFEEETGVSDRHPDAERLLDVWLETGDAQQVRDMLEDDDEDE